jgi:hypothetical protein
MKTKDQIRLIKHECWLDYITPLFSSKYGLIYHNNRLSEYARNKQKFVDEHWQLFCSPMNEYLKSALKIRNKIVSDGKSNIDHPDFLQFLVNIEDWLSKKDVNLDSIFDRKMDMIRFMIPSTWMVLFEIKLKLYKL